MPARFQKILFLSLGSLAIVLASFFATLYAIDTYNPDFNGPNIRNRIRARHAELLKGALEKYRAANNSYPNFPDNNVDDLKKYLVDPGYLSAIPVDPSRATSARQYHYTTDGKTKFGLLIPFETTSGKLDSCLTGINTAKSGMWGQPPDCPF